MELETAIKLLDHGWRTVLSAAGLVLAWTLVRPGGGRNRPLLAVATERIYSDLLCGVAVWWRYRREALEARAARDRAIEAAYAIPDPGGPGEGRGQVPAPRPDGGEGGDTIRR